VQKRGVLQWATSKKDGKISEEKNR